MPFVLVVFVSPSPQIHWYETMRWFAAGVAFAVNVAACFAIGGLGEDVTDRPVGMPGAVTVTVCCVLDVTPALSVTESDTANEPPVVKACVVIMPDDVPSPPKFQVKVQLVHETPSSVLVDALNVTVWPTSGDAGLNVNAAVGAVVFLGVAII